MRLADWLKANKLTQKAAADKAGIDPRVFHRYVTGTRLPSRHALQRLYSLTDGQVDPNSFYDLPALSPGAAALEGSDSGSERTLDGEGQVGPGGQEGAQDGGVAPGVAVGAVGHDASLAAPPGEGDSAPRKAPAGQGRAA